MVHSTSAQVNGDLPEDALVESIFRQEYKKYLQLLNSRYSSFGVMHNGGTLFRNKILSRFQEEKIDISENIQWVMRSFYAYRDYGELTNDKSSMTDGLELDQELNHQDFPKDSGELWTPSETINGERVEPDGMVGNHPALLYITPLTQSKRETARKLANAFSEIVYVVYTNGDSEYVEVSMEDIHPGNTISASTFPSNRDFDKVLQSLYIINKIAKKHANDAQKAYTNHRKGTASHYSSKKSRLYSLKATVINTMHHFADNIEKHIIDGDEFFCLYFTDFEGENWSFHIPTSEAQFSPDVRKESTLNSFDSDSSFEAASPDTLEYDPISFLTDKFTGTYRYANSP